VATLVAGGVIAGAASTTAAYYLGHVERSDTLQVKDFTLELQPTTPGPYQVTVPIPVGQDGREPPGFALRVVEGSPSFRLVSTERGLGLFIAADGPVKLAGRGDYPVRLSLEDPHATFKQFRFFGHLAPGAAGPVLLKLEVRERTHTANWELHADAGKAILLQEPLRGGWQQLKATHLFDVHARGGWGDEWPRLALGAAAAGTAALYLPLGVVLRSAWPRRDP
jgi:hypothetical protein